MKVMHKNIILSTVLSLWVLTIIGAISVSAKNYAVLISADKTTIDDVEYHSEFWYDLFLMYEALYENGFTHTAIHVLYGDGNDFQSSHTRYQIPPSWGISKMTDRANSEANVQDVFADLSVVMTNQDFLWIWWMGHGEIDGSCPNIYLKIENTGERVYDHEFASYVDQIADYKSRSFSIMTCHSGGIIDDIQNNKTVVLTAVSCPPRTYSGLYDVYHAEFTYNLFCALDWETPAGISVDADDNSNGLTSMYEAWDYTYENRTWRSNPQYSDLGSIGENMYIFCCGHLVRGTHLLDDIAFTGDVNVDNGITLTIDSGVAIKFEANNDDRSGGVHSGRCELIVNGTLNVNGTQPNPVTLSSSAASPQKGDWYGIRVLAGSSANLQYADIYYTRKGIYCNSASPTILNCTIHQFSEQGIYCYYASPTIQNSNIRYGGSTGIYVYGSNSSPQIDNQNQISNCSVGIDVQYSSPIIDGNHLAQQGGVFEGIKLNTSRTFNITNNYFYIPGKGIRVVTAPSVDIRNNQISGVYGIEVSGSTDVYNNNISYSDCGIWINSGANPNLDGGNNIENNDMNVTSYSSYSIDAENNW